MLKRKIGLTLLFFFTIGLSVAQAIPSLQIYLPDGEYDAATESWVTDNPSFRLDVVGAANVIADVKIALLIPNYEHGSITINRITDSGTGPSFLLTEDLTPPTTPDDFYAMEDGTFGDRYFVASEGNAGLPPLMGDGTDYPNGALPSGLKFKNASYYQFYLGDFGLGMNVADYGPLDSGETYDASHLGHVERLLVAVNGYTSVDVIGYNHIVSSDGNNGSYVKTPGSHDGAYLVPEPSTFVLLGFGLIGLGLFYRRKRSSI